MNKPLNSNNTALQPYLSPLSVWALSIGSAIGWGCLVVTCSDYLLQAGPMGSILGLLIGLAMMFMVSNHYHFLANRYPGTGGLYNYVKYVFGYDRAFLVAWFMFLIYIAIFWANATSIPLSVRYFIGDTFQVVRLYKIFDYDVYLGEAVLTLVVMGLVALLCILSKKVTARSMGAGLDLYRRDHRLFRGRHDRPLRDGFHRGADFHSRCKPVQAGGANRLPVPLGVYRF